MAGGKKEKQSLSLPDIMKALDEAAAGNRRDFPAAFFRAFGVPDASLKLMADAGAVQHEDGTEEWRIQGVGAILLTPEGGNFSAAFEEGRKRLAADAERNRGRACPFMLATDFEHAASADIAAGTSKEFSFAELSRHAEFFLPMTGRHGHKPLSPLVDKPISKDDYKAIAKLMQELCWEITKGEPLGDERKEHDFDVFLARLIFCFFAEDAGICGKNDVTNAIRGWTMDNASDLAGFFKLLFKAFDTEQGSQERQELGTLFEDFPYVNGGLFHGEISIPSLSRNAMEIMLKCGGYDWKGISTAIFGQIYESCKAGREGGAVERRKDGMHYTPKETVFKVIGPLFLDEMKAETARICALPDSMNKEHAIDAWREKAGSLVFLDPACGSGNFLALSYKAVREIETDLVVELRDMRMRMKRERGYAQLKLGSKEEGLSDLELKSRIYPRQFRGIEIDGFSAELAKSSMHVMQYVCDRILEGKLGLAFRKLPLRDGPKIVHGDALKIPWDDAVLPKDCSYIMGNPPFGGVNTTGEKQKKALAEVFRTIPAAGGLDYVAGWFRRAFEFMRRGRDISAAFVATNSICQGSQVFPLWKPMLEQGARILFAHQTFRWSSDVKGDNRAVVSCIIVGFGLGRKHEPARLFKYQSPDGTPAEIECKSIGPYLLPDTETVVRRTNRPLCGQIPMVRGNQPTDGGHLILDAGEAEDLRLLEPEAAPWIRPLLGAKELLHGGRRYCLWLPDAPEAVLRLPLVAERIEACRHFREENDTEECRRLLARPHTFRDCHAPALMLVFPRVSSERRLYIPIVFVQNGAIATDRVHIVPNAGLWEFGIASSAMHMAWTKAVCGRLKIDYNYSSDLCWNPFPWPQASLEQKAEVEQLASAVLAVREGYPRLNLGDMYNPETMPEDLKAAHAALDRAVDGCYRPEPFASDEERLHLLFKLYEDLIAGKAAKQPKEAA